MCKHGLGNESPKWSVRNHFMQRKELTPCVILVGDLFTGTANDFVASVKRVVPGRRKTTAVPAVFLCCADRRKITGYIH